MAAGGGMGWSSMVPFCEDIVIWKRLKKVIEIK